MGSLYKVWVELPEDLDNMGDLEKFFKEYFGYNWLEVMTGAEEPFVYHRSWNGYIAIKDLRKCSGLLVADLKADQVYKIILG